MARKYFVRNYLKGFRRDKDPSGTIHRNNALGIRSGRGSAGGRSVERTIDMNRSLQPSLGEAEAPRTAVANIPLSAPPAPPETIALDDETPAQLNPQPIDSGVDEAIEDATIREESPTGLPGANAGARAIPVSEGAPSSPSSLGAERSPIAFTAKKRVVFPWSTK